MIKVRLSLRWKAWMEISSNDILIDIFQHRTAKTNIRMKKNEAKQQFLNDLKGKRESIFSGI